MILMYMSTSMFDVFVDDDVEYGSVHWRSVYVEVDVSMSDLIDHGNVLGFVIAFD